MMGGLCVGICATYLNGRIAGVFAHCGKFPAHGPEWQDPQRQSHCRLERSRSEALWWSSLEFPRLHSARCSFEWVFLLCWSFHGNQLLYRQRLNQLSALHKHPLARRPSTTPFATQQTNFVFQPPISNCQSGGNRRVGIAFRNENKTRIKLCNQNNNLCWGRNPPHNYTTIDRVWESRRGPEQKATFNRILLHYLYALVHLSWRIGVKKTC